MKTEEIAAELKGWSEHLAKIRVMNLTDTDQMARRLAYLSEELCRQKYDGGRIEIVKSADYP